MMLKIEFSPAAHPFNPLKEPVTNVHEIELNASIGMLINAIAYKINDPAERQEWAQTYEQVTHLFSVGARKKLLTQDSVDAKFSLLGDTDLVMTISRMEPLVRNEDGR
jgi:hypothetical protein